MSDKIQCKKCKKRIPNDRASMWKHAISEHWDTIFQHVGDKVEHNENGAEGLYRIGHELGKQMQMDGVNLAGVVNTISSGLAKNIRRLK